MGRQLAYVTHSGFGHQLQMLLRGLFLAQASNRTLLLPPLMTHRGSLDYLGAKGCTGTAQRWEYWNKDKLLEKVNTNLLEKCETDGDSFTSVFDLQAFTYRDTGCGTVASRRPYVPPCSVVHYTATKLRNETGWLCDQPPPCHELLGRLRQRARDMREPLPSELRRGSYFHGIRQASLVAAPPPPPPTPPPPPSPPPPPPPPSLPPGASHLASVAAHMAAFSTARQVADHRAKNGTLCLGPINEYYIRGLLRECSAHPLARELSTRGLPLRHSLLKALRRVVPPANGCGCVYTRLDDEWSGKHFDPRRKTYLAQKSGKGALELIRALSSSKGLRQLLNDGSSPVEVVSNCFPHDLCSSQLRARFGKRIVLHPNRSQVAGALGLTPDNAMLFYDLYRCARCPQPLRVGNPGSNANDTGDLGSSFFGAIDLLHARLHGGGNMVGLGRGTLF